MLWLTLDAVSNTIREINQSTPHWSGYPTGVPLTTLCVDGKMVWLDPRWRTTSCSLLRSNPYVILLPVVLASAWYRVVGGVISAILAAACCSGPTCPRTLF